MTFPVLRFTWKLFPVKWLSSLAYLNLIQKAQKLLPKGVKVDEVCLFFHSVGETANHLLVQCPVIKSIWELLFAILNVAWAPLLKVSEAPTKVLFNVALSREGKWIVDHLLRAIMRVVGMSAIGRFFWKSYGGARHCYCDQEYFFIGLGVMSAFMMSLSRILSVIRTMQFCNLLGRVWKRQKKVWTKNSVVHGKIAKIHAWKSFGSRFGKKA